MNRFKKALIAVTAIGVLGAIGKFIFDFVSDES
jgi:hypothetical protein